MVSMNRARGGWPVWGLNALAVLAMAGSPLARAGVHEHGVVKLDVAVDGNLLTLQLEAPLDSLLGFEHQPRTEAQRQAADAVLKRFNDGASLFQPSAAALCTLSKSTIDAQALQPRSRGQARRARRSGRELRVQMRATRQAARHRRRPVRCVQAHPAHQRPGDRPQGSGAAYPQAPGPAAQTEPLMERPIPGCTGAAECRRSAA